MRFNFFIGTRAIFGDGCIKANGAEFLKYGKRALVVTGKRSAKESGALDDICEVLGQVNIDYNIMDKIENNPTLENVALGAKEARKYGADFIIGIGGGSPLDASKAIAVLAVNDIDPVELYKNKFVNTPLPIMAIPTTAGTGSEVTPYSILTRNDIQTKMSFGNQDTFPKIAFLDPGYTECLPMHITVNTAVDTLTHAIEGYISKRSMPASDVLAVEAIRNFGLCKDALLGDDIDYSSREKLLYASMLGGMVISHTGTTILHGMGYNLTYFLDIPHGRANGLLLKEYLEYNYDRAKEKIDTILELLNVKDICELGVVVNKLLGEMPDLEKEEIDKYAALTMKQKSTSYNIREVNEQDIKEIYKKAVAGGC